MKRLVPCALFAVSIMFNAHAQTQHTASPVHHDRIRTIMHAKKTNCALAADVTTMHELIVLADAVGPHICLFKMHCDIITDFSLEGMHALKALARKHNFLIVEDRKFADIGNTMILQYSGGVHRIAQWADLIIVHALTGKESVQALANAAAEHNCALLLVGQLSSAGNLIDADYSQEVLRIAQSSATVVGYIAQERIGNDTQLLVCTPGIHCGQTSDAAGQRYNTPETAIARGTDIIIVGRAVYSADDPAATMRDYKERAWQAYQARNNDVRLE